VQYFSIALKVSKLSNTQLLLKCRFFCNIFTSRWGNWHWKLSHL